MARDQEKTTISWGRIIEVAIGGVFAIIAAIAGSLVLVECDNDDAVTGNTGLASDPSAMVVPDTPTATNIVVFNAPTENPKPVPTYTPIPITTAISGVENALARARNFSGSNADWDPFVQEFDGVEMVLVPAGCFMMGSEDGDSNEQPVHEVCFDEPFWIDRTEVTNAQYGSVGIYSGANWPYDKASWVEARDFCAVRGARLPIEAEWEYVARGPDALVYPWGNEFDVYAAAYKGNSDKYPSRVGSRLSGASWVGALDMSGNVWEWTNSVLVAYSHDENVGNVHEMGNGNSHVLRGGSISDFPHLLRATERGWFEALPIGDVFVGFRCARDID